MKNYFTEQHKLWKQLESWLFSENKYSKIILFIIKLDLFYEDTCYKIAFLLTYYFLVLVIMIKEKTWGNSINVIENLIYQAKNSLNEFLMQTNGNSDVSYFIIKFFIQLYYLFSGFVTNFFIVSTALYYLQRNSEKNLLLLIQNVILYITYSVLGEMPFILLEFVVDSLVPPQQVIANDQWESDQLDKQNDEKECQV